MPNSRKRKSSVTIQGPLSKQQRNDSPIVISDDSDDDVRHVTPPRLTAKQKGKGRAALGTDDSPRRPRDIDVISIPDDEPPIFPTASPHQTPLEVPDHQSSESIKEMSAEFEASSEALPPDQILEQFKDIFLGENKCSQCARSVQPVRSPVCSSPHISSLLLTCSCRYYRQISKISQNRSTFSAQIVKSVIAVDACHPFSVSHHVAKSMNAIQSSVALALESSPFLRSLRYWISTIFMSCLTPGNVLPVP